MTDRNTARLLSAIHDLLDALESVLDEIRKHPEDSGKTNQSIESLARTVVPALKTWLSDNATPPATRYGVGSAKILERHGDVYASPQGEVHSALDHRQIQPASQPSDIHIERSTDTAEEDVLRTTPSEGPTGLSDYRQQILQCLEDYGGSLDAKKLLRIVAGTSAGRYASTHTGALPVSQTVSAQEPTIRRCAEELIADGLIVLDVGKQPGNWSITDKGREWLETTVSSPSQAYTRRTPVTRQHPVSLASDANDQQTSINAGNQQTGASRSAAPRFYTSTYLKRGNIYSRTDLRKRFDISAVTMDSGIFKPRDHDSVWLFITEKKAPDVTQYADSLAGDTLYMDGQRSGRTDRLIVEHEARGLEILLFYRRDIHEHPNRGFVYEGRFRYVSHTPGRPADRVPSKFVLKRAR